MTITRRIALFTPVLLLTIALSACGGGGGEGGSGSTGGSGGFTLAATSASFKVLRFDQPPDDTHIGLRVTGDAVAAVGAAFVNQVPPSWLFVDIEGTSPNFTLVLGIIDTALAPGHYTSTVTVGTADRNNNVLTSREVQISYDVIDPITVSATPQANSFVFGSSRTTQEITVTIGAPGKSWTITSNQPWLPAPSGTQQGSRTLTLTLNGAATGQAPGGTATAQLVFQNTAEPVDRRVVDITAAIAPPRPIVSVNPVVLGGTTGLDGISQALDVSLDTGTNAYPWTLTFDTPQSPSWVVSDVSTGSIAGTQHATVTLSAGPAVGAAGNYTATANFDVVVANQTFRTGVPVTMKWHGQRLVPDRDGVAFTSFPSRAQPAAQTIKVRGSRGMNDIPWTATSNQDWLSVTASGVTGGDLTLSANPAGLATDTVHIAEVTLASTSSAIERNEKIRVGIWVGAVDPVNTSAPVADHSYGIEVNPIAPLAYALFGGAVHVYNMYSGAEINTIISGIPSGEGSLAVSSDGSTLYVANIATARVLLFDAATGNSITSYQSVNKTGIPSDSKLLYTRTNGYPLLFTPFGTTKSVVYDLETGSPIDFSSRGISAFTSFQDLRAVSPDGSRLFDIDDGSSSDSVDETRLTFGVVGGRTLQTGRGSTFLLMSGGNGFFREMCVSASGTRLYATNYSMQEIDLSTDPPRWLREVPHPAQTSVNAVECNWNGRVYVGLSRLSTPGDNALVLDPAGNDIGTFANGPADSGLVVEQMRLSGDSRRMVSTHVQSGTPNPIITLQFYEVPP